MLDLFVYGLMIAGSISIAMLCVGAGSRTRFHPRPEPLSNRRFVGGYPDYKHGQMLLCSTFSGDKTIKYWDRVKLETVDSLEELSKERN